MVAMAASALAQEPAAVDPEIQKMVAEISPARIEATVRRLVEFRSGHTWSDTASATQGIGAAAAFGETLNLFRHSETRHEFLGVERNQAASHVAPLAV